MSQNRRLSIIIPVFNGWPYIKAAVDSILEQTYTDFDLIIVNDGSTDNTNDYLSSIIDNRVKIIWKNNTGVIDSFNIGLQNVNSEYVARVDADDVCAPNKFTIQMEYLTKNPNIVLLGCSAYHLSEDGSRFGWPVDMPQCDLEIRKSLMCRKSAIIQPTMVCKTSILKDIGGYREGIYPEDYDLYFRLLDKGEFANLKDRLYYIRLHSRSMTAERMLSLQLNYGKLLQEYQNYNSNSKKVEKKTFKYVLDYIDATAIIYYRKGLYFLLKNNEIYGYSFLLLSSILSPKRFCSYLLRRFRK